MVDLYELRQLAAFAELGTLSRVAEEFHLSTPSVTRSMQHLEAYFGVPLFRRGKNRIELNDTGRLAVSHAQKLLGFLSIAAVVHAVCQAAQTADNGLAQSTFIFHYQKAHGNPPFHFFLFLLPFHYSKRR